MEELTIEEKAARYDEAINIARKINSGEGVAAPSGWTTCEVIFPELKENEDEKIRKELIRAFKSLNTIKVWNGIERTDILAWLEKQGEQKLTVPKWRYKNDNTPLLRDSLILNKYGCVGKSPSGALVNDVWVMDYGELAKLPKEEIEKQGEQKTTDKVEPKFKVGDWVVQENNGVYKVIKVRESWYEVANNKDCSIGFISFNKECICHRWTIKDAKAGDVLFYRGNIEYSKGVKFDRILLFENLDKSFFVLTKSSIGVEDYCINANIDYPDNIIPATKEQKEILFMVMKDAGYEWSSEHRKLIKRE